MEKQSVIAALAALAHETRLDVFRLLVRAGPEGVPAGQLAETLGIPAATLSFHLKELSNAGLARAEKQGRSRVYSGDFEAMRQVLGYLTENCCADSAVDCPDC